MRSHEAKANGRKEDQEKIDDPFYAMECTGDVLGAVTIRLTHKNYLLSLEVTIVGENVLEEMPATKDEQEEDESLHGFMSRCQRQPD